SRLRHSVQENHRKAAFRTNVNLIRVFSWWGQVPLPVVFKMGEKQVMANASKVGDRLGEPPAPELVEHVYTPGPSDNHAGQFTLMSAINKAHGLMLQRQRILTDEVARQLLEAILQVEEAGYEGLDFDPTREDLYFNYEHAVVEHTSAAIGGQMHTGRSRNDLGATMVRMRSRGIILSLVEKLVELRSTLLDKAAEYQDVVFPGYTHLQPAQPVTLGHYFTAVE